MTKPSPVYFGPDGCGTCGRREPDHAAWCADVGFCLRNPHSPSGRRFRALLPDVRRVRTRSDAYRFDRQGA
jgi:hypothetical protein